MAELTLSYQALMEAVYSSTGIRDHVFPSGCSYVALPLAEVMAVVDASPSGMVAEDANARARRLWYSFKVHHHLCACGIVRLRAPVAHDILGIITAEDLRATSLQQSHDIRRHSFASRDLLDDEISEFQEQGVSPWGRSWREKIGARRPEQVDIGSAKAREPSTSRLEMTLIEPQTGEIFKRSQGGSFGQGCWPISEIRAFAVWF